MRPSRKAPPVSGSRDGIRSLVVTVSPSSFSKQDVEILRELGHCDLLVWRGKLSSWRLLRALRKADVVVSWFAADHAFAATVMGLFLGKPSIVIVGGHDVAEHRSLEYGRFVQSIRRQFMTKFSLRFAAAVFPVSQFTEHETRARAPKARSTVIYNGVPVPEQVTVRRASDLVVCVGSTTWEAARLKGIPMLLNVAKLCPDLRFVLIGPYDRELVSNLRRENPNVTWTGALAHDDVQEWFSRASVYCQFSERESFGVAVAEAMAHGCVPVVTGLGGVKEVVDDCGFIVVPGDIDISEAVEAVRSAADAKPGERQNIHAHIASSFSVDRRRQALTRAVREVVGRPRRSKRFFPRRGNAGLRKGGL